MNDSLATFRKPVNEGDHLQGKLKGGADLVGLGMENAHDFSEEGAKAAYEETADSEEEEPELIEFELEAVAGERGSPVAATESLSVVS